MKESKVKSEFAVKNISEKATKNQIYCKNFQNKIRRKFNNAENDSSLMKRISVEPQKYHRIDLSTYNGKYGFSTSSRYLFRFDRKVHSCTDKSKSLHALEEKILYMEITAEEEILSNSN